MRPTKLIVSLSAVEHNARLIREAVPGRVKLMCVVKADAYGHGATRVARRLEENGLADGFAVALAEEAAQLREAGVEKPILVLGGGDREELSLAVRVGASHAVFDRAALIALNEEARLQNRRAGAHLALDTGMVRVGVPCLDDTRVLEELLSLWKSLPYVRMEGVFTHFAAADTDPDFTSRQNAAFLRALGVIRRAGFAPVAHAAASEAFLDGRYQHDMVRPGIVLYGSGETPLPLVHAQTLITRPVRIETIPAGATVGYGRTYTASRETRIATLPVGYGDGYPRILGGRAASLVNGRRAPLAGRVCMDMLTVDITDIPGVTPDSEFVLLGRQDTEEITPEELASLSDTIPYEIMLGFLPRVARVWQEQEEE